MKPLGLFFAMWNASSSPAGLDDDYDEYVRQQAAARPTPARRHDGVRDVAIRRLVTSARAHLPSRAARLFRQA